jgi:hypothetical protein
VTTQPLDEVVEVATVDTDVVTAFDDVVATEVVLVVPAFVNVVAAEVVVVPVPVPVPGQTGGPGLV